MLRLSARDYSLQGAVVKNIFWTGGWDSTFRVLDLIINQKVDVRPYYLVDKDRPSTPLELETIQTIRDCLSARFPEALKRLQPLEKYQVGEIEKDKRISEANIALTVTHRDFSTQYHWIARFVKYQQIGRLEMSFNKDDKPRKLLADNVEQEGDTLHISDKLAGTPEHTLFQWFFFPLSLWNLTKRQTRDKALKADFLDILEHSWFCHYPINYAACGRCSPCRQAIEEGMGYRLPWRARFLRYPQRLVERWVKKNLPSGTVGRLQSLKERTGI